MNANPYFRRWLPLAASAALVALTGAGCKSGRVGNVVSETQENDMGRQYSQQIDTQTKLVMDGKVNRRILSIAQPIFEQAMKDRPGISYRIRVIDDPQVNAFSLPGGYIYIYRGLLDKLGSDDDAVACVIAHESAHVVRRHVAKQMSDANGKGILVDLASLLTRSGAVSQIGGALYELDQLHFSREDEYEADRWGERFAYNAGYDPSGMVRTFQILERLEKQAGIPLPYALDHPISQNRILRAQEQLRELRANKGQYVSEAYDSNGDRVAARKNDISYQTLVLATTPPTPPSGAVTAVDPIAKSDTVRDHPAPNPNGVPPIDMPVDANDRPIPGASR